MLLAARWSKGPRRRAIFVAPVLALSASTSLLLAQQRTVLPVAPSCRTCRIDLRVVGQIGSAADSVSYFIDRLAIARLNDGRMVVGPRFPERRREATIDVYDSQGRRTHSFGINGEGPREVSSPYNFALINQDSILVFAQNKMAVVALRTGAIVRELPQARGRVIGLPVTIGDDVFVSSAVADNGVVNGVHAFQLQSGAFAKSFGPVNRVPDRPPEMMSRRALAQSQSGQLWVAHADRYQIELWNADGKLVRSLVRNDDWLQSLSANKKREAPPTMVVGVYEREGILWVLTVAPKSGAMFSHQSARTAGLPSAWWDTVIEAVDPAAGRVLASVRVPEAYLGFHHGGLLALISDEADGAAVLRVLRPTLVRP